MEKIKIFIGNNKYVLLTIFFIIVTLNQCSINRKLTQLQVINIQYKNIEHKLKDIEDQQISKEQLILMYEIKMYEFLKLQLDDNNKIVRTVVRPEVKLREYDDMIKKLQEKQINSIKK